LKLPLCRPNFFIVGAPKSGTTSLYHYLSQHPDVCMATRKEPCFLAPDFKAPSYPQTEEEYLKYFDGCAGALRVGEATSTYLYSKLAAQRIHEYAPDARIIAMLRNPVDLAASLHAQRLKEGYESIGRFEDALAAESDRRKGKRIPKGFPYPIEYLLYREVGKYAAQLRRFFDVFGRSNVQVIIFDDFLRDTRAELDKVCDFLGISRDYWPVLEMKNVAQVPRVVLVHRLLALALPVLVSLGRLLKLILPRRLLKRLAYLYTQLHQQMERANLKTGRPPLSADTRSALLSYYAEEITDVERLLGRDLSAWRH
jgi:hypothetical protein